jgi:hypothetical protein
MSPGEHTTEVVTPLSSEDIQDPEDDRTDVIDVSSDPPAKPIRRARRLARLRFGRAGAGVWVGLLVTAAGFGLIAVTWSKTASLIDVSQQIPYLVSGGLVGLGLILVGLLVINLTVKRREAAERQRQLEELKEALVGLRASIEGEEGDPS